MTNTTDTNIDEQTISKIGLTPSEMPVNANLAPNARVFKYPHLDNVFIMESDLYGNPMPKDSCFIAFNGSHGIIGRHLTVEALRNSTIDDIKHIVESNS